MTSGPNPCGGAACSETWRTVEEIVQRSPLDLHAVAFLLASSDDRIRRTVRRWAGLVRKHVFGTRVALFAPLYLSNDCTNNCLYCGFRRDNRSAVRRTLTVTEAVDEARVLAGRGLRRILLVAAEHPAKISVQYLSRVVRAIREETPITEVGVNVAPMAEDDFRALRESGASAYQCFQETYQREVYSRMHPSGKKRDYAWRSRVMDRAVAAGFTKIGMGILLGLGNLEADVTALVDHVRNLISGQPNLGVVLSFPRIRPAAGAELSVPPSPVSDEDFAHVVAICRLALPSADIAISTRERAALRDDLMELGGSMMSAGSVTAPGGYSAGEGSWATEQFAIEDTRSVAQVGAALRARGLFPSY